MQTTLQLFSRTFSKVPQIEPILYKLRSSVTHKNHPYYLRNLIDPYRSSSEALLHISAAYFTNFITARSGECLSDSNFIVISQDRVNKKFEDFYYDYEKSRFVMSRRDPLNNSLVCCKIDSLNIERLDHPSIRKSLYFHELKDMHKYTTIKNTYGFPS